jgi:hypothetical protein
MITGWAVVALVTLVAGVVGYMVVRGKMSRTVTFRRRYPEDRVVDLDVTLPGR